MGDDVNLERIRPGDVVHIQARVAAHGYMGGREPRVAVVLSGGGEYVIPARCIIAHEEAFEIGARVRVGLVEGDLIAIHEDWGVIGPDGCGPVPYPLREIRAVG